MNTKSEQPGLDIFLRKLLSHSPLPAEDQAAIAALPHSVRHLEPNSYILREGERSGVCPILCAGFAYRQKSTQEGGRQIVALKIPGDALDFQNLFLDVSDHSVQMLTRAEIANVAIADLQALARQRPAVAQAILVKILVEASIFREWVLNVGRRDSKMRVAHLLCELGVRLEVEGLTDDYAYELPMTQEQLGDAVGLTPVHVNRTLKALEADGLIVRSKRSISFPDWHRLRGVADFNQRYLHLEPQRSGQPG